MLSKEKIQNLRKDPNNYKWGGIIYYCREDPYVVLPKRVAWMGWTLNFAHPQAIRMLIAVTFFTTVPLLVTLCYYQNAEAFCATFFVVLIILCAWMHKEATKYDH